MFINKNMYAWWKNVATGMLLAVVLTVVGCSGNDDVDAGHTAGGKKSMTCKVAVILSRENVVRWKKIADWATANLKEAEQSIGTEVNFVFDYKSEDDADIDDYIFDVANDTTYCAVIGPCNAHLAEKMASAIGDAIEQHPGVAAYRKPMITPTASDVEYQRKFSEKDYLWNMAECDITQIEIIMSQFSGEILSWVNNVTLLASANWESQSGNNPFLEWAGFIAEEYGVKITNTLIYKNIDELRAYIRQYSGSIIFTDLNKLLFLPSSEEEILALDEEFYNVTTSRDPSINNCFSVYCSDMFVSQSVSGKIRDNNKLKYEGFSLYASPESGFIQAYSQHFHEDLFCGEAQFYDAICMIAFAAIWHLHSDDTLFQSMHRIVNGQSGQSEWACFPSGMKHVATMLKQGNVPLICGATGAWNFDPKYSTKRQNSVYRHWCFNKGQFTTKNYLSLKGSAHTLSSQDVWEWTANNFQQFEDSDIIIDYAPLHERWALLVAASKGWGNYRFQADVLAMYHILRDHGYDDDHIVMIAEDDLAYNPENKNDRGAVRIFETGDNIYVPSAIDYKLTNLSPDGLDSVMLGLSSQQLPHVIGSTNNDNVFIFWSGHGLPKQLDFGDSRVITYSRFHENLAIIPHRKMLVITETCYSGGLGATCEGVPGLLFITAASPTEECHATRWSNRLGVYLSNTFSDEFQEIISLNPHTSLRDLYYMLAQQVSGSHVKLYNNMLYGNIYHETMAEFLE